MHFARWSSVVAVAFAFALPATAGPALDGNCVVCLYEMGKPMPGKAEFQATYDRQSYCFPGEQQKNMFLANPRKYVPALGGDCTVCFADMGRRMPGKAEFSTKYKGRLYLFPGQAQLTKFNASPDKYAGVDQPYLCYCPVCLLNAKKLVEGKPDFVSTYDGFRYFFPDAGTQAQFNANPAQFAPALGGKCTVCLKEGNQHVRGKINYGAYYDGRIFLFPEQGARRKFMTQPARYGNLDLAHGGNCVVCSKKMGRTVPGKAEIASTYQGQRYLFPSPRERTMFEANPEQFLGGAPNPVPAPRPVPPPAPRGAQQVNIVGKTACAGCEFGVKPIADPQSLGIAVVTGNTIYVVEQGEAKYPTIFADRFDGKNVQLKGTIKRKSGRFVWVNATELRAVR